jgi:hypothetical protein
MYDGGERTQEDEAILVCRKCGRSTRISALHELRRKAIRSFIEEGIALPFGRNSA